MCDCIQHIAKKLSLEDDHHSDEDKNEQIREPTAYTLIHWSKKYWKNIGIQINSDTDKSSSSSKLSSYSPSNNRQCYCGNVPAIGHTTEDFTGKFNVVAKRIKKNSENLATENDDDQKVNIECTLAIIKPGAMKYKNAIKKKIIEAGFQICQERILQLSPEQASELYSSEYGKLSFPMLAVHMSSGPIAVYILAKHNAVSDWQKLIGPKDVNEAKWCFPNSIRAVFGEAGGIDDVVHGSASKEEAVIEINFFFPNFFVEPFPDEDNLEDYLKNSLCHVLIEGLTRLCKERPRDPLIWLADWLMDNNPIKPKIL